MGILYLVPTPVGNLEDITYRALRILKEADLILAEDTRTTGILLKHFEIKNAMLSYHKFNEHQAVCSVVSRLNAGETVAVVSDAGTPGISDPGFLVAREAVKAGVEVVCLPGARLLYRPWSLRGFLATVFALKVFFRSRKAGQPVWRPCLQNPGPLFFMNLLIVWSRR
mgnify:CR=1 FL=1